MTKMMTKFIVDGANVSVIKLNEDTTYDQLPPRVYTLNFNKYIGFFLTITKDQLQLPEKIYGNVSQRVNKCVTTYKKRPMSTGVLMTGDKGTGKTLLMSLLANTVITDLQIPVILIRDAYAGEQFASFIEQLGECCLVFDEFGKMYPPKHSSDGEVTQEDLLSLMDGVDKTKRMFILTENNERDISDFMLNRPSRIYYHFRYRKLEEDSIRDFCVDHNINDNVIQDIVELSRRSRIFSFDMLQSIVEEYDRFQQPIEEIVEDLNIDIDINSNIEIEIIKVIEKKTQQALPFYNGITPIVQKPLSRYDSVSIRLQGIKKSDDSRPVVAAADTDENEDLWVYFDMHDLKYERGDQLVYETQDHIFIAREITYSTTNYNAYF